MERLEVSGAVGVKELIPRKTRAYAASRSEHPVEYRSIRFETSSCDTPIWQRLSAF